jgi:UDP-glucuronate decarboxylase
MTGIGSNIVPKIAGNVIAVAGGAGFIGSHLCDVLIEKGDFVVCLDNLSTGSRENIEHLLDNERFVFINHDITQRLGAGLPRFDEIYNLACPASPVHYQADRVSTALTCALGTMTVLDRAARDGAKIFHASTSEVYGDPEVHPQPEGYFGNVNPIGPRSCYDEGKRFAETLLTDYADQYGLTVKIARIFNTYGPRMQPDDGRVVSNFIVQALRGDDLTIYGDGQQTRSFCYVDDLVRGIVDLMNSPDTLEAPVNLGNPGEFTVAELAHMVIDLTGSSSKIVKRPRPVDDPSRRRPDISRAERELGWTPTVKLRDGLRNTIPYFANALDREQRSESTAIPAETTLPMFASSKLAFQQ